MLGPPSVNLPTEARWKRRAPDWAADHWESFYAQLNSWCEENNVELNISETAVIFPVD